MATITAEEFLNNPFWVRKMKARFFFFDTNKDNVLSVEDFDIIADKYAEYGGFTKEQVANIRAQLLAIWKSFGFPEGAKLKEEDFIHGCAKYASSAGEHVGDAFNAYFDVIDTDKDGLISTEEYTIFLLCSGTEASEVAVAFDALDTDRDGIISRAEFIAAAIDYSRGFDETSPSRFLFGGKRA